MAAPFELIVADELSCVAVCIFLVKSGSAGHAPPILHCFRPWGHDFTTPECGRPLVNVVRLIGQSCYDLSIWHVGPRQRVGSGNQHPSAALVTSLTNWTQVSVIYRMVTANEVIQVRWVVLVSRLTIDIDTPNGLEAATDS